MGQPNGCNDALQIAGRQVGAGREAEPVGEQILRDGSPDAGVSSEDGLQVHRLPDRPGLDVCRLQGDSQRFAIHPELLWLDRNAGEPTGVAPPRRLGHECDAGKSAERFDIEREVLSASCHSPFEHAQLPASYSSEHVAQTVVEPISRCS